MLAPHSGQRKFWFDVVRISAGFFLVLTIVTLLRVVAGDVVLVSLGAIAWRVAVLLGGSIAIGLFVAGAGALLRQRGPKQ